MKDFYAVLEIPPAASERELKSAYRRPAKRCHPDKNQGAPTDEKFKALAEAYQVDRIYPKD